MNTDHVLTQLAAGQITADEAAQRLRGQGPGLPSAARTPGAPRAHRWLHVRVTNLHSGQQMVSVNLPLTWVELGLQIGARYSPEIAGLDLNQILAELHSGANGKIVDVEDLEDGKHVEIFVD